MVNDTESQLNDKYFHTSPAYSTITADIVALAMALAAQLPMSWRSSNDDNVSLIWTMLFLFKCGSVGLYFTQDKKVLQFNVLFFMLFVHKNLKLTLPNNGYNLGEHCARVALINFFLVSPDHHTRISARTKFVSFLINLKNSKPKKKTNDEALSDCILYRFVSCWSMFLNALNIFETSFTILFFCYCRSLCGRKRVGLQLEIHVQPVASMSYRCTTNGCDGLACEWSLPKHERNVDGYWISIGSCRIASQRCRRNILLCKTRYTRTYKKIIFPSFW